MRSDPHSCDAADARLAGPEDAACPAGTRLPTTDRRFVVALVGIAAIGVLVRVVYVMTAVRSRIPLVGDAETYHLSGQLISQGHGYIRPFEFLVNGRSVPTAEFPPLLPLFLAAVDVLGVGSPLGQRLVGAAVGGVTIIVIGLLGLALGGRPVGLVAAAIAAVYPQVVVLDTSLLSEGLVILLVSAALLCLVHARAATGTTRTWWWLGAGVFIGTCALARSESLLLLPLLLVPAARVPGDRRAWLRGAAAASVGSIVLLGTWTVRNAVSLGHVQPFTNNSGTLLAGTNCDDVYHGELVGLWQWYCVVDVPVTGLDESETAARRRTAGLDYAVDNVSRLPVVSTIRLARTVGVWDVREQLRYESQEGRALSWLWAGWIAWLALAPAAVVGAVIRRRRGDTVWFLLVPPAIVAVSALFTYGNQRFRAIAEPSVIVLAATAVVALAHGVVARRARDSAGAGTA